VFGKFGIILISHVFDSLAEIKYIKFCLFLLLDFSLLPAVPCHDHFLPL
jgi:hypothetical protein